MSKFESAKTNVIALALVQISNAVLPMVVFPLVLARVGSQGYSDLVTTEALALFLVPLVLYSFDLDGVAKVTGLNLHENREVIGTVLFDIVRIRTALAVAGTAGVVLVQLAVEPSKLGPLLGWLLVPISYAASPAWLFQALQKNIPYSAINVVGKALMISATLVYVKDPSDYVLVSYIVGISYLAVSIASLFYVRYHWRLTPGDYKWNSVSAMLRQGGKVFVGSQAVVLYRDLNVLLLSLAGASPEGISAYSVAEKFVKCMQAVVRPLNQHILPIAIAIASNERRPSRAVFRALFKITVPQQVIFVAIILVASATFMLDVQLGELDHIRSSFKASMPLALPMALAGVFGIANFMLGTVGLNYTGAQNQFLFATLAAGVASVLLCVLLASVWFESGAVICFVLAEVILFAIIVRIYHKQEVAS